jgi:hypothetical protein
MRRLTRLNGDRTMSEALHQCACCDYFTLTEGHWEICPVCFWEDDGLGLSAPDEVSGPNHISLRQARANFQAFGACDQRMIANVLLPAERSRYVHNSRDCA